jgi:hypothetical protein
MTAACAVFHAAQAAIMCAAQLLLSQLRIQFLQQSAWPRQCYLSLQVGFSNSSNTHLSNEDQLLPPVAYGVIAAEVSADLLLGCLFLRPLLLQRAAAQNASVTPYVLKL